MAISASGTINRIPSAGVPAYASPNPEGVALCDISVVGDGTAGAISGGIVSSGQFLYRLELFNMIRGDSAGDDVEVFTLHDWATVGAGFGANSFDILWPMENINQIGQQSYSFFEKDMRMIRRFPLGSVRKVGVTNILFYQAFANTDTILYSIRAVFTYWRKEALALPGFLQSFYEAPFVPGGVAL